jgi:hypothetical protein
LSAVCSLVNLRERSRRIASADDGKPVVLCHAPLHWLTVAKRWRNIENRVAAIPMEKTMVIDASVYYRNTIACICEIRNKKIALIPFLRSLCGFLWV